MKYIQPLVLTLLLAACQKSKLTEVSLPGATTPVAPPENTSVATQSAITGTPIGVKTGAQLNRTFAVLTGVDPPTATINSQFNNLKAQLPMSNDLGAFQASHQVAIMKLATEYCQVLFESADARRTAFMPEVNFALTPTNAYPVANRPAIVRRLLQRFWGESLESLPSGETSEATLLDLFAQLMAGAPNDTATTRAIMKGLCTATLAAAPVTTF